MEKVSKEAARYTAIAKMDDHCSDCRHFTAPHSCARVIGDVNPGGWCKLFSRKHALAKAVKHGG